MIGSLTGSLIEKSVSTLIVEVSGVGYEILISPRTFERLPSVGATVHIKTHTHVREDELTLFGFLDVLEKNLFLKLIKVNGIGPRLALNILSGMPPQEFLNTIYQEDETKLTSIPGVGKKMAARMLVDLKDKIQDLGDVTPLRASSSPKQSMVDDVVSALMNLGYTKMSAQQAVAKINVTKTTTLESLIRDALQSQAGGR
jgi:holliday junction DNA helicase RuvA